MLNWKDMDTNVVYFKVFLQWRACLHSRIQVWNILYIMHTEMLSELQHCIWIKLLYHVDRLISMKSNFRGIHNEKLQEMHTLPPPYPCVYINQYCEHHTAGNADLTPALERFTQICWNTPNFVKIQQQYWTLTWLLIYVCFWLFYISNTMIKTAQ
jgi:hypothetical protein